MLRLAQTLRIFLHQRDDFIFEPDLDGFHSYPLLPTPKFFEASSNIVTIVKKIIGVDPQAEGDKLVIPVGHYIIFMLPYLD